MSPGQIDQVSHQIGSLSGAIEGLREIVVAHHQVADQWWDRLDAELRTIKHDQRGSEQKIEGIIFKLEKGSEALQRIGDKVRPLEDLPARLTAIELNTKRIDAIEAMVEAQKKVTETHSSILGRAIWLGALLATPIWFALEHYSGAIIRFLATKF